jgi:tetratricopeptide (TPR) repeat protein
MKCATSLRSSRRAQLLRCNAVASRRRRLALTVTWAVLAGILLLGPARADPGLDAGIRGLTQSWDHAQFELASSEEKLAAFQRLEQSAAQLEAQYPGRAEPIVWDAIIVCSEAGAASGADALNAAGRARHLLERAERINPNALGDGSIYTSLGLLYYQAPGYPVGFGNRDRARQYLERALSMNPNGVEPNYFMGDFLLRQGEYAHAVGYLRRAMTAPPRPGREIADRGWRSGVAALLRQAESQASMR